MFFAKYKDQYRQNLMLALPVMLTQLGQITTQMADNLMVGNYGGTNPVPLAAVSFGGSVSFIFFIASIGVAIGLTPLVGELYVRGEHKRSAALLHNGILFYVLLGFICSAAQYAAIPLMSHMGQPDEVVTMAIPYYKMLLVSMPFVMLFFAFKQFLEGVGNTKVEMVVTIIANAVNIALNWVLIFGRMGFDEMGATGAGLSTLISRILASILIVGWFASQPVYRPYLSGFSLRRWSWTTIRKLIRMGMPISAQAFTESSAFVGTSIMMGWLGTEALSANHISITVSNCSFMIVMAIGAATTIRVSHCYGMRDIPQLSLTIKASYHLVLLWNAIAAITFISLRFAIPAMFTQNAEVISITASLLVYAAMYQLSDGLQHVSAGALRGIQDVKIIMPIAVMAYWVLNLPVGYLLAFHCGMGPDGLFAGYIFGLSAAAVLMIARIRKKIRYMRTA